MAAYSECERWVAEELSLREQGKVLTPREIVVHVGSHEEKIYHDEVELAAIAQGLFCIRCHNPQPEDDHVHKEKFRRMQDHFPNYVIPAGLTRKDCCCYCGQRLDIQQEAAA